MRKGRAGLVFVLSLLLGCGGGLPPIDPPEPPKPPEPTPCSQGSCPREMDNPLMCDAESGDCVVCEPDLSRAIWNMDAGDVVCSTLERPVKHWPPDQECPVLTDSCPPPQLPIPQCPRFTDRGGEEQCRSDACDCYCGQDWVECPEPPPIPGECCFPPDDPAQFWRAHTPGQKPTQYYNEYRHALATVGDRCGEDPMETLALVAGALEAQGVCAMGPAADGISIFRVSDGLYEEWHAVVFNPQNPNVGCTIDNSNAHKATWEYSGTECDGTSPPSVECCPIPDCPAQFALHKKHNYWDSTFSYYNCRQQCECIGYFCMPSDGTNDPNDPNCNRRDGPCPVADESDPNRPACEVVHIGGKQRWFCDGEEIENTGNPAQAQCFGHVKTCTVDLGVCSEADW